MNPFEFALGVLIVLMIASVIKAGIKHGAARHAAPAAPDADAERLREEVRTLKERIAVLERIATDKSARLEHEIEALRER